MRPKLGHNAYRVGWICPLEVEQVAAMKMLDEEHERLSQPNTDPNFYNLGSINNHNVVITGLPRMGNSSAATVATHMRTTFPFLKYVLLVGIGGGVPVETEEGMIRLGHVVVSEPKGTHSGAVQYDYGKATADHFERKGFLAPPPSVLLGAARDLAIRRQLMDHDPIWENIQRIPTNRRVFRRFEFPGPEKDHLYPADYEHRLKGSPCEEAGCDPKQRINRLADEEEDCFVVVHSGTIASGDLVLKDAKKRDALAREHGVLCFEMEAAGVLTDFPCMVIRGISDYCDSHKNDVWHGFAAAAAAAYARQLFFHIPMEEMKEPEHDFVSQFSQLRVQPQLHNIVPQVHHIIPSLENRHFTGREFTLGVLQQKLFLEESTDKLAMFGLGGIGKTQVALQLARWVKEHISDCSVFWAPALSVESFEQACSQIVKELQIRQSPEDEETAMETVHRYLSTDKAGRWLFIIDNADDASLLFDELEEWFPSSKIGVTLLTTRTREVAVSFAGRDIIELEKMTTEEGSSFLTKIVGEDSHALSGQESTTQLLEELNFLPLAISQAAFYICRHNGTVKRYLELMHKTEKDWMGLASRDFHDSTRYRKLPNAVTTTWLISYNQMKASDPFAADLLDFISFLEPKAIPRSILLTPGPDSEEEMDFAIGTLCSYGFLIRRNSEDMFDIHSLVQLATRAWISEAQRTKEVVTTVTQHIARRFPSDNPINRGIWRMHLPHALGIVKREESKNTSERYDILLCAGRCLVRDNRTKEAIPLLEDVCTWNETRYDEEHPDRLDNQLELARAYEYNRQMKLAIQLFEFVNSVRERTLDGENIDRLRSQSELAAAYRTNRQLEQSIEILEHVVAVTERTLDEENADRLNSQHELGRAYRISGKTEKAVELLEHVVTVTERTLDEENSDRLIFQHELAQAYRMNGNIEKAIELLEYVVAVEGRTLDEDDHDRLISQHELARAYCVSGNIGKAVDLLEHVVAVEGRTLDEEDHSRLNSEFELARNYRLSGKIEKAIEILEHVVIIKGRTLDETDTSLLVSQHELAKTYRSNGQIEKAIELFEHVIEFEARALDEEDRNLLTSQYQLAEAYLFDAQIAKAIELYEQLATVEARTLDDDNEYVLLGQYQLAQAYLLNKETEKAIELFEHVVEVEARTLDEDNPSLLASQHELARAYNKNGQTEKAIEILEHVVTVEASTLDEADPDRLISERLLEEFKQKTQLDIKEDISTAPISDAATASSLNSLTKVRTF